jgi:site-specific DNA recombinase
MKCKYRCRSSGLITAAIASEHRIRADNTAQHRAEVDGLTRQIATAQASIDRYLNAFENGTLDEAICGRRIRDLTTQLDQLTGRRSELNDLIEAPPQPLDQATIEQVRRHLDDILSSGTLGQRKAVIETHIAEIRIDGDRLIPIYRIPADTFRTQGEVVGRTLQHANRFVSVPGNTLPGRFASSRHT